MNFHMDMIRECFPTWVHLRILETLMRKPQAMSQRQLASVMGIPRATAQRALNDLGQTGLIQSYKIGSAVYWDLDKKSYLYEALAPILEALNAVTPPLPYLKKLIRRTLLLPKKSRCILFGSTATAKDISASDIDLCITLSGKMATIPASLKSNLENLQDACREKFGRTLSPIFVSEKELSQHPDKDLHRQILKGIEIENDSADL